MGSEEISAKLVLTFANQYAHASHLWMWASTVVAFVYLFNLDMPSVLLSIVAFQPFGGSIGSPLPARPGLGDVLPGSPCL